MKRQAFDDLQSAIKAHSQRTTLEDLAARGKRTVRVVSSKRVLELIERIVDDAIRREALEIASKDRDRIVSQTREQFDRALRAQNEQDAKLREHRERSENLEADLAEARRTIARLESDLAIERDAVAVLRRANDELTTQHESELASLSGRRSEMLADAQRQVEEAERERRRARQVAENALERGQADLDKITDLETRLATARATLENYDAEFERLNAQLREERARHTATEEARISELENRLAGAGAETHRLEQLAAAHDEQLAREREDRAELAERLERVRKERDDAMHEFAVERAERAAAERRFAEEGQQVAAIASELRRLEGQLAETERKLGAATGERDALVERLNDQLQRDAASTEKTERVGRLLDEERARAEAQQLRADEAVARMEKRESELTRLTGELAAVRERLERTEADAEAREHLAANARTDEVDGLRTDLDELKQMLAGIAARPAGADEKALTGIVGRLEARDDLRTAEFEERFSDQLDKTLSEVTREMRLATARPLDYAVEATDVLVDRLFDEDEQMSTNLGMLAVEERSDKRDIAGDLARLRKARTGQEVDV